MMPGASGKQSFEKDKITVRKNKGSQKRDYLWQVDHCSQLSVVCCWTLAVLFEAS
jgi:dTDP-D-glucose 4,6-dehydratase